MTSPRATSSAASCVTCSRSSTSRPPRSPTSTPCAPCCARRSPPRSRSRARLSLRRTPRVPPPPRREQIPPPPQEGTAVTTAEKPGDDRVAAIHEALNGVMDPEIHRPLPELGMVDSVEVDEDGIARVHILVTIEGCPMRDRIERDTAEATATVPGLTRVEVTTSAMTEEQRRELTTRLRQGRRQIPFNQPGSLTRIFAVSSGKGGVGKSTVTANLAAAMAADGLRVGVIDADIHGFSMPGMFGITDQPTKVSDLLMPPVGHGVAVMSIGMFVPEGQAVVWRG